MRASARRRYLTPSCTWRSSPFFAIRFTMLGKALIEVAVRSHLRLSKAGEPLTVAPGATSPRMPDCAVTMAPSPMVQWPTTPTCPARITFLPTWVEPARPTWEQSSVSSPTRSRGRPGRGCRSLRRRRCGFRRRWRGRWWSWPGLRRGRRGRLRPVWGILYQAGVPGCGFRRGGRSRSRPRR